MYSNYAYKEQYVAQMQDMVRLLNLYYDTMNSKPYQIGARKIARKKQIRNLADELRLRSKLTKSQCEDTQYQNPDYFSDERIAVYTCYFGSYDQLDEPYCKPDNIDYYVITDQEIPDSTVWKRFDISPFEAVLEGLSNVEKNRWFKFFPDKVFSDYRYSVYIDGNVVPVTDFTEFINKIGDAGIAMFRHSTNNCIYQEALYNKYRIKKISKAEVDGQVRYLRKQGMPENYGMTTCNVIARDHSNQVCIEMMNDWWDEFINRCRRDQLSFSFVAWKHGIKMKDIATLGDNVWHSHAFYVKRHTL